MLKAVIIIMVTSSFSGVFSIPLNFDIQSLFKAQPPPADDLKGKTKSLREIEEFIVANTGRPSSNTGVEPDNENADFFNINRNFKGGHTQFRFIPPSNQRVVHIIDLSKLNEGEKLEMQQNLTRFIEEKHPISEDKRKVQALEERLIRHGMWAKCSWEVALPAPLDNDVECYQSELKFLLEQLDLKHEEETKLH